MLYQKDQWRQDQATALRALAGGDHRQATTIAVTSGKGGVAKSNVALNLAVALAFRGLKVALLDLDLGLANIDVLLNLNCRRNLSHLVAGTHTLDEIIVEGPAGVQVVPGASGLERLANVSEFERNRLLLELRELEISTDFLIMDLGAGVGSNVISFAGHADVAAVVTTPEPTALADAYAVIKLLSLSDHLAEIELLVNQADSRKEARLTYDRLAEVAGRFLGIPVAWAGYILSDDAVLMAVRSRRPFLLDSPSCNASACIRAIAQKYAKQANLPIYKQEGFFGRVARMFQ